MRIEALTKDKIPGFIAFCRKHRNEVDDSYLYDDQLKKFEPDAESPTYVVRDEDGEIIAAASLVMDEYHRQGDRARFRILYAETPDPSLYSALMEVLKRNRGNLNHYFIFLPTDQPKVARILEDLGFILERYAFVMVRDGSPVQPYPFPPGYEVRPFRAGIDESAWCEVRNLSFATLKGSETPMTEEMVKEMNAEGDSIEDGLFILYHEDKPVGVVRGFKDEHEDTPAMGIGPLALLPEYQRKGLGRLLLRYILDFSRRKSYGQVVLSVNGENIQAKELYIREGFKEVSAFACYRYVFKDD